MNQFTLEILFKIIGIGSASGLFYDAGSLYLISDNGSYLYDYNMYTGQLDKIPLFESETTENIAKIIKPDFEALTAFGDSFYIFGSGSTPNRNTLATFNLRSGEVSTKDLSNLYFEMRKQSAISQADFNIEGVVNYDGQWLFLQRGNGGTGRNGIFTVTSDLQNVSQYKNYTLPKIGDIEASFTDAVLVNNKIYFLATAENTLTAYDDGDVLGSLIGQIDLQNMEIESTQIISVRHKLEGITLYENTESHISFLICEDNDSDRLASDIFKLEIRK